MQTEVVDGVKDAINIEEADPPPLHRHLTRCAWRDLMNACDRHEPRHRSCDCTAQEAAMRDAIKALKEKEEGAVGYILAWAMGVPVSVLFLIFLVRGCR